MSRDYGGELDGIEKELQDLWQLIERRTQAIMMLQVFLSEKRSVSLEEAYSETINVLDWIEEKESK